MPGAGLDDRRVRFCSVQGHSDLRMAHTELAADRDRQALLQRPISISKSATL
jgi:hypothetical protein